MSHAHRYCSSAPHHPGKQYIGTASNSALFACPNLHAAAFTFLQVHPERVLQTSPITTTSNSPLLGALIDRVPR